MPARSKSQQRLFGAVHAYNNGEFRGSPAFRKRVAALARHISDEDARHFAKTPHDGLPEKKADGLSPAILSRDVAAGAVPRRVVRDDSGMLQIIGPRGNDPADAMVVAEREVDGLLAAWNARRRSRATRRTGRTASEKRAQVMVRPEVLQEMYGRVPIGEYASAAIPREVRSERRRSFLGSVLYGTGAGAVLGGLGAAGLGAVIANGAARDAGIPQDEVRKRMLEAAARLGLWGAGRGAAVGSVVGAGLGVVDKVMGNIGR